MTFFKMSRPDKVDRIFSEYIRKKAGNCCEYCGRKGEEGHVLQCSPFFGRRMESVRFDPNNADCFCVRCHMKLETEKGVTKGIIHGEEVELPRSYRSWKISKLGLQRFQALEVRAHQHVKKDRVMSYHYVKALMADLDGKEQQIIGEAK